MIPFTTHTRAAVVTLALLLAAPASAQTPAPIQVQETNIAGVVAELTECRREDGVLNIRVRFRNNSDQDVGLYVVDTGKFNAHYLTAGTKKYFILRDTEKTALANATDGGGNVRASMKKGGTFIWWAKFPAPPPEVKKVSYFTPVTGPFDNVPIQD